MATATTRAPRPGSTRTCPSWTATAVPARTGATDAASVAGRAASHQMLRASGEPAELGLALLDVGVTPLLGLLAEVVEQRGVARQLLDAGQPVVGGVHARLDHPERQRAVPEHLAGPAHGLLLQALQRHDPVDEAHLPRLL